MSAPPLPIDIPSAMCAHACAFFECFVFEKTFFGDLFFQQIIQTSFCDYFIIGNDLVMTAMIDKNREDVFPLLMVLFLCIVVFYLARPPVLMFFNYKLSWLGGDISAVTAENPQGNQVTPPETIEPPSLPASLQTTPAIWREVITPDADTSSLIREIATITNQERADVSRIKLQYEPLLSMVAARHSKDMLERDYLDHISPEGDGPSQRVAMQHRRLFGGVGENVAYITSAQEPPEGMAQQFMQGWMNSPGHRRNILSADYTHLGVGCYQQAVTGKGQIKRYCTQVFAKIYATATTDIAADVRKGSTVSVELMSAAGMPLPTNLILADLANGATHENVTLTASGSRASGDLIVSAPKGLYALQIHVPKSDGSNRYWIVSGPYINITE